MDHKCKKTLENKLDKEVALEKIKQNAASDKINQTGLTDCEYEAAFHCAISSEENVCEENLISDTDFEESSATQTPVKRRRLVTF